MFNLNAIAASFFNDNHSIFGPSSSHMWLTCSGSLVPNILAEDIGSTEAADGTVAHSVSEEWLIAEKPPLHLIGQTMFVPAGWWGYMVKIDEEMFEYVRASVDRCLLIPGEQRFTEQRVDHSHLTPIPNQGGTMDYAVINGDVIYVIDHKYGAGVRVYAERNSQGMLYAIGLLRKLGARAAGVKRIVIRIHQPRLDHFDEWEVSRDELMEFGGYVRERAKLAWRIDAPRTADPKACEFCKVKSTCAANVQMQFRLMADMTADAFGEVPAQDVADFKASLVDDLTPFEPELADPLRLDTAHLAKLLPYRRMVTKWWEASAHELLRRALNGVDIPGMKPVEGRSFRAFKNEKQAVEHLVAAGIPRKELVTEAVASPADVERIALKHGFKRKELPELLEGLITKPPGKPTLAPLADRRPELVDLSAIAWGDADAETTESEEL